MQLGIARLLPQAICLAMQKLGSVRFLQEKQSGELYTGVYETGRPENPTPGGILTNEAASYRT